MISSTPTYLRERVDALQRRPPWALLVSAALIWLLTLVVANSTVTANWVSNSDVITKVALVSATLFIILALIRQVPWPAGLAVLIVLAPVAAFFGAGPAMHAAHPEDPADPIGLMVAWFGRLFDGSGASDTAFYVYLLCLLFWVVGGWLAWCTMRWQQPLLGIVPGAAAFATNVLNYPTDQNTFVLAFLVLTLFMLLWSSYLRSLDGAARRRVKLSGDARWDFWESGAVVLVALVMLGIFLPPLSTTDRTVDFENGTFRSWAEIQQRLNHPVAFGRGAATGTSIGFNTAALLGGPIHKTGGVVFTYQKDGSQPAPPAVYFRGLNLVTTGDGQGGAGWHYYGSPGTTTHNVDKNVTISYAESYDASAQVTYTVQMLKPPDTAQDVLFYPGESVTKVDRNAVARTAAGFNSPGAIRPSPGLTTVDRLSGAGKLGGAGSYKLTASYSVATEDQLRSASTDYPTWLDPYRNFATQYRAEQAPAPPDPLTGSSYRPKAVEQMIRDLALQVTQGSTNVYDMATAIETYLRANYTYTLTPNVPPHDADPIGYFLFTTKEGYCEYFASAMGDMLRSLGIPTRLVNGYGPGTFDEHLNKYVVKESDAHTWVEVYFPKYGWIPFEPTPDGVYFPIPRGFTSAACARDAVICDTSGEGIGGGIVDNSRIPRGLLDPGALGVGTGGSQGGGPARDFPYVLGGLAFLLLLGWLLVARYLRPRTVGGVWKRLNLLSRIAGFGRRDGETPHEFGARLAREVPEAAVPIRELADKFALSAYAPDDEAASAHEPVLSAWADVRPVLLRQVARRRRAA